jgi:hypothetical protein
MGGGIGWDEGAAIYSCPAAIGLCEPTEKGMIVACGHGQIGLVFAQFGIMAVFRANASNFSLNSAYNLLKNI